MLDAALIEMFERDHPGVPFPAFRLLDEDAANAVRAKLCRHLFLTPAVKPKELSLAVHGSLNHDRKPLAASNDFDLASYLAERKILAGDAVLVCWDPLESLYEFSASAVCTYFDDLWIEISTDVYLIGADAGWVVGIDYLGYTSSRTYSGATAEDHTGVV